MADDAKRTLTPDAMAAVDAAFALTMELRRRFLAANVTHDACDGMAATLAAAIMTGVGGDASTIVA